MGGPERFDTLELYRQVLIAGVALPSTRDIEVTTLYQRTKGHQIQADQLTAVFLVPTDEAYFQSQGRAITVYRYQLVFAPSV